MMDQHTFEELLRDALPHLYDVPALETHPLVELLPPTASIHTSRGARLQHWLQSEIEGLRPQGKEYAPGHSEWRPYVILQQRYVAGASLAELASRLALSERQLRREHNRALRALAGRLWYQLFGRAMDADAVAPPEAEPAYRQNPESLDLRQVCAGVLSVMAGRFNEANVLLHSQPAAEPHLALADRVILRQVLISLLNYCLELVSGNTISVRCVLNEAQALVELEFSVAEDWATWQPEAHSAILAPTAGWRQRLSATLEESYPPPTRAGVARLRLGLPRPRQAVALVVDDQEPTQRLYRRFLTQSGWQVVGLSDPQQVLELARQLKPQLITLDVMMPGLDGWELLQALKADAETRFIPVLVCSAWADNELARSLGAAGVLRKPLTQKDLLAELERLGLS
jgi:CheY-like chemotaxis protein